MEKEFNRTDGLFSLCGLNCGLCPMQLRGECSGCFNGSTCYQTCPITPCSVRHGNVEYCYQCREYPCKRYDDNGQKEVFFCLAVNMLPLSELDNVMEEAETASEKMDTHWMMKKRKNRRT